MPLTDISCKSAKPSEKPRKLADGGGLYLEILPSGGKCWRLKYRFDGKENRLSLGKYPIVSLDEARKKRTEAKTLLSNGINPSLAKQEQVLQRKIGNANTFEAIAKEWLEKRSAEVKPQTLKDITKKVEKELFPRIGKMPIKSITSPILLEALRKVEERGVYETTKRVRQYAGQIFMYAISTGRADNNPSQAIAGALKTKKVEHQKAMPLSELPNFLKKVETNDARLFKQTILALKLMILTFTRKTELAHAKWNEVDFKNAMWTIPAERMKMEKPHLVPLSRQSLAILEELKNLNGEWEYIFIGQVRPKQPMSEDTLLRALYRLGYKGLHTIHGFRSLALTAILENLGYRFDVADAQLAHSKKNALGDAYDRSQYLKERKVMMQDWADFVDELVSGKKDNKVLKFHKKK